jgi:hypothetical protein
VETTERKLDEWYDRELEVAVSQVEWDIRFQQNYSYATNNNELSEKIRASVRQQQEYLKKLRSEREYRITHGSYHPFLEG